MNFLYSFILLLGIFFCDENSNILKHEIGIFNPYIYKYSDIIELSTHPIFLLYIPNFSIKINHNKVLKKYFLNNKTNNFLSNNQNIFTHHSFYIPTKLLNKIKKEGTGGIISPEFEDFPFMISFKNMLIYFIEKEKYNLTLKTGCKKIDNRTTIDLPIVYHRLGIFYNGAQYHLGLEINKTLIKNIHLFSNIYFYNYLNKKQNLSIEHRTMIQYNISNQTELHLGYKLVYGEYPFGKMYHLLPFSILPIPLFDIIWKW